MNQEVHNLPQGLYLVSTPIGNLKDLTLRALEILKTADRIVAEDTRSLRKLLTLHGVQSKSRSITSYHEFSKSEKLREIVRYLEMGESVALVSEAGTPLISDPGYKLVRKVIELGLPLFPIPGPSALTAALIVSGLGTDQFHFVGFLPQAKSKRNKVLVELKFSKATLIFFEASNKLHDRLTEMEIAFGGGRKVAICRELTKLHEEIIRGSISQVKGDISGRVLKGEIVIVVERNQDQNFDTNLEDLILMSLKQKSLKDTVNEISNVLGISKNIVYKKALELKQTN